MGHWSIGARVRIVADTTAVNVDSGQPRFYRAGEEVRMFLRGQPGQPLADMLWWSSLDTDGAYILRADEVEVIDLLGPAWMTCGTCGARGSVKANEAGDRYLMGYWDRAPEREYEDVDGPH